MTDAQEQNVLVIERVFNAPVDRVWDAWTDPEKMKIWTGPKGFTAPVIKQDFRVGGKYLTCMQAPDGQRFWSTGVYKEIIEHEKIVATDSFADEDGNVVNPTDIGMPADFPREMLLTVLFEALPDGNTKLTIRQEGMPASIAKDAHADWNGSLDKLEALL